MDQQRFDDLARSLGANNSRRAVLKGLLAGAAGGVVGLLSGGGALAAKGGNGNGKGQSKKSDCCPDSAPRLCDNQCVNFDVDPNHCGDCNTVCGPNDVCQDGQCVCVPKTCADLGAQCGSVSDGCGGMLECGSCGPDEVCESGTCVPNCSGTICNGVCVDTSNDPTNCGTCGNACSQCQSCTNGSCVPVGDGTLCDPGNSNTGVCVSGACVDTGTCSQGATQSCYSGSAGTSGIGICQSGTQTCQQNGTWGSCLGEVTPQPEDICGNSLDDDCDGVVDGNCV